MPKNKFASLLNKEEKRIAEEAFQNAIGSIYNSLNASIQTPRDSAAKSKADREEVEFSANRIKVYLGEKFSAEVETNL